MSKFLLLLALSGAITPAYSDEKDEHGHEHGHRHDHAHPRATIQVTDVNAADLIGDPARGFETSTAQPAQQEKLIRELLEMIHHSIEPEDHNARGVSGFLRNWVAKLNLKRAGINVFRYYQSRGQEGPLRHLVPDILTMLAASHAIESTSALWGTSLGASLGLPHEALVGIGVIGGVISVPGLDPLCIGLMFAYGVSQTTRDVVRMGKVAVFSLANVATRYTGIQGMYRWLVERQDRVEWLLHTVATGKPGTRRTMIEIASETEHRVGFEFRTREEPHAVMRVTINRSDPNRPYLESVEMNARETELLKEIRNDRVLKLFGWNTRDLLKQAIDHQLAGRGEHLAHHFYVEGYQDSASASEWATVRLTPRGVTVGARHSLNWANVRGFFSTCGNFLRRIASGEILF